jgi:putative ATP-dependent endonuclease of the OLD family
VYIDSLKLWNFRKFGAETPFEIDKPHLDLKFRPGVNLLIGENDSGKSAIIDAIRLTLDTHSLESNRCTTRDFFRDSRRLRIELTIVGFTIEEGKHFAEWLGWRSDGQVYLKIFYDTRTDGARVFPSDVKAGPDEIGSVLSAGAKELLRCTYLKPLRDAANELVPKRNSRLSKIFLGHDAFKGQDESHHLVELFRNFNKGVKEYFEDTPEDEPVRDGGNEDKVESEYPGRKLKRQIDSYLQAFSSPDALAAIGILDGNLREVLEKLILSISSDPNPGLGSLNRLFMAAELVNLSKDNWEGIRLGLVEELEAHLHPQVQMQVVEKLQETTALQLVLTSHSPNLASKVKVEHLVICNKRGVYPMAPDFTGLEPGDYQFLNIFLDVTKSNLLFAAGVVLVEGWSEAILIPALARAMKRAGVISKDLTDARASVINLGALAYVRYSRIFLRKNGVNMGVPVAILRDVDVPEYRYQSSGENQSEKILVKCDDNEVARECEKRTARFREEVVGDDIKLFASQRWTLEYCLHKSKAFGTLFRQAIAQVHPQIDLDSLEGALADKLLKKTLDKVNLAYHLATLIEGEKSWSVPEMDDHGYYLCAAIRHAIGL